MTLVEKIYFRIEETLITKNKPNLSKCKTYSTSFKPDKKINFDTEQEAIEHWLIVKQRALVESSKIIQEIQELQTKMGFSIGYSIEGDTHGLIDYQYISFKTEGLEFQIEIDR
jgi:hypothetical protein